MAPGVKTIWTDQKIRFIKKNWILLSNKELAKQLDLKTTVVRMKKYELGLNKFKMIYWTKSQSDFLINNFAKIGDCEIAEILNLDPAAVRKFTKKHVNKKRRLLFLHRSKTEINKVCDRNIKQGRHTFLHYHKSGTGLSDKYVAGILKRSTSITDIEKHPHLIEIKKLQLQLNRMTRG